ncbi:MAG: MmcQ/YjbR family DNA-binding protein [Pseudomonadota bacterium]
MTPARYNAFCSALAHATHVRQWGNADVWKIGGKVFAIGGWNAADVAGDSPNAFLSVTFKCSDISYDLLRQQDGCRPAPYLASRGMTWIQRTSRASLDDAGLEAYLRESYRLASLNLTKKLQQELGLNQS